MNAHLQPTGSAYFIAKSLEKPESHTLSVLVDNEPGVLARVIGLFSGRGYNIDSLTVSETEHEKHMSRITIVTRGTPHVLEQIKAQLERIVPVHRVVDLTVRSRELGNDKPVERELALVKVAGTGDKRVEALRLADAFRASVIDANVAALRDDVATGLQFAPVTADALNLALQKAATLYARRDIWQRITARAMAHPVGWDASARDYAALYDKLTGR